MSDEICVRKEIHLPNEILAIIINKLASDAEDNDRTLAALTFLPPCLSFTLLTYHSPLIFVHTVDRSFLSVGHRPLPTQILTTRDIAESVYTLTLRCQKENLEINGTLISVILHRLPHIRTFILGSEREALKFTAITGDFKSAIKALCRSPRLTTLDLSNIADFPIAIIAACPSLRRLRLSWVAFWFDYTNPIDGTSSLQPYNLDSLEIDEDSLRSLGLRDSNLISFAKIFSRIKNLRLRHFFFNDATVKRGWHIILMASQSLTTLDLPRDDGWYITVFLGALEGGPFNLGRFPVLRHFQNSKTDLVLG